MMQQQANIEAGKLQLSVEEECTILSLNNKPLTSWSVAEFEESPEDAMAMAHAIQLFYVDPEGLYEKIRLS